MSKPKILKTFSSSIPGATVDSTSPDTSFVSAERPATVTGEVNGQTCRIKVTNEAQLAQAFKLITATSVHRATPDARERMTEMVRWCYMRVRHPDGRRTRHLLGWVGYEGRVCSAIVSINPHSRRLTTE